MGHLQQAVAFFQQNQHWTTQVKDLSISATYLLSDMMTTALIPTIFQYISHLKFTDVEPIAGSLLEDARLLANTRNFIQFRNNLISWKNLTHIVDGEPSVFDVTKSLLNSTTLNNLGYLELSFPRRVYHGDFAFANSRSQADFKHFLNSIQNAPNLNQLVLKEATVQLADIKKLHDKTPNLLDLKFEEVRLSATDDGIEQVSLTAGQENTSSPLRSVELGVYSPYHFHDNPDDALLRETISNILLFVGNAYNNLRKLCWYYYGVPRFYYLVGERALLNTIFNLTKLTSYTMMIYPGVTE